MAAQKGAAILSLYPDLLNYDGNQVVQDGRIFGQIGPIPQKKLYRMPHNGQIHYTLCLPPTKLLGPIGRRQNPIHIKRGWISLEHKILVLNTFYFNAKGNNANVYNYKQTSGGVSENLNTNWLNNVGACNLQCGSAVIICVTCIHQSQECSLG